MSDASERELLVAGFQALERHVDQDGQPILAALRKAVLASSRYAEAQRLRADILGMRERVFACNPNEAIDDDGYDLRDPKHPNYHSNVSSIWDLREGK